MTATVTDLGYGRALRRVAEMNNTIGTHVKRSEAEANAARAHERAKQRFLDTLPPEWKTRMGY